jgi:hypothetical protein
VEYPANHHRDVCAFTPKVVRHHRHVREDDAREYVPRFVYSVSSIATVLVPPHAALRPDLRAAVLQGLLLREYRERAALLQRRDQEVRVRRVRADELIRYDDAARGKRRV